MYDHELDVKFMGYIIVDTQDLKNIGNFNKVSKMIRISAHISKCPADEP